MLPPVRTARAMRLVCLTALLPATAVAQAVAQEEDQPCRTTPSYARVELQANVFTASRQDGVALDRDAAGRTVLVWQSRRQEEGTYGVYARRFDARGTPLGGEVRINATTEGMQMQPAVALDAAGAGWFTWRSFGHDGDGGAILARRFAPDLSTATPEVLVNQHTEGHQTDAVVAALPDGGALVVWLSPDESGLAEVRARHMAPDGRPAGDAFRVDAGVGALHRTPTVAVDAAGNGFVAYARTTDDGRPIGLYGRRVAPDGTLEDELRLDVTDLTAAIEPALASGPSGDLLVGWLEPAGEDHGLRVRGLRRRDGRYVPGPVRELEVPRGPGYTSGLALALDGAPGRGAEGLVCWNRHADGPRRRPGLFARRVDGSGAPQGEPFRVTARDEGAQAIAVATGSRRAWLDGDGRMGFAWHGDAGLGDESAANLTLLAPAGRGFESLEGVATLAAPVFRDPPVFMDPEGGARPHDPPTFDPRDVDRDRGDDTAFSGGPFSFLAFTSTGWTPPDPEMAVGPGHIVCIVNGGIAWFLKDGTQQFQQNINGGGGFFGSLGAGNFVFDPEVIWDPHAQRFIAFANERNGGLGRFLFAISDDADPNGAWHLYAVNGNPLINDSDIDSPNISVDDQAIYMGADYFGPDKFLVVIVDKSSVLNGGSIVFKHLVIMGDQSFGMPVNFDTGSSAQYMIHADEFVMSTQVEIWAITNPLSNPQTQKISVTVPSYSHPADPPQMGTTSRPELFEARFWSAVVRDGSLWAVHHQGQNRSRVRWYEFDLNGWPGSGNPPTLVQSANVPLGAGIWGFFPSIWADEAGNMALTFARSSTNEFISMQMTYRLASDPLGKTRPPELVIGSLAPDNTGRWGDYSATNDDPAQGDTFWGHHEYRIDSGWRTRVGRMDLCAGSITNYCVGAPNSVGSGAVMGATGSTSIGANDLVLQVTAAPPNQFGLFYMGQGQVQNPNGDGFMCIGGGFVRFPALQLDGAGAVSFPLDLTQLGQITPGSTWDFQFWYRDPPGGPANYNFSDGLEVLFCD